ncbi:Phospholipase A and acyltransferase 2 [Bulinus truncatus]|nr:Phospholipase A and acyltransferase 2 [Bulinus truncatus]
MAHYSHNQSVYRRLKVGDRVSFNRRLIKHWGIYIGSGQIVHLVGEEDDGISDYCNSTHIAGQLYNKASVRKADFWEVAGNDEANIDNSRDSTWRALDPSEIARRAEERIGKVGYNVIRFNCEHFTNWCRYGKTESDQVDNLIAGLFVGAVSVGVISAKAKLGGSSKTEKHKK